MAAGEDVGVLVARLIADTTGLQRDMQRATQQLNTNTAKMNRSLATVDRSVNRQMQLFRQLRTGVLAVASSYAVRFVKAQIDAGAALLDQADKVGINIERLQDLHFAAQQYAISQGTVDMAVQRLSRRVGEAVQGQGELVATLKQYNIAVVDAEGRTRNLDAIIGDLAEAIQGAESDQERLRIAFKAFDSEGAALVNVLKDGREGLQQYSIEAGEAGRLTEAQAEKLRNLRQALANLAAELKTGFLVFLAETITMWSKWAEAGKGAIEAVSKAWKESAFGQWIEERKQQRLAANQAEFQGLTPLGQMFQGVAGLDQLGGGSSPLSQLTAAGGGLAGATGGGGTFADSTSGGPAGATQNPLTALHESMMQISELQKTINAEYENMHAQEMKWRAAFSESIQRRVEEEKVAEEAIHAFRTAGVSAAVGLLQALGAKHRGAAIAVLAVQKALAIKEVLIQSQVAAMRALAELGPIAGAAAAKKILIAGKVSAGLIAATGLVGALDISHGDSGLGASPATPLFTTGTGSPLTSNAQNAVTAAQGVMVTQVFINGPIYSVQDFRKAVTEALKNETDRDVIIITNNSRQAAEIRRGGG